MREAESEAVRCSRAIEDSVSGQEALGRVDDEAFQTLLRFIRAPIPHGLRSPASERRGWGNPVDLLAAKLWVGSPYLNQVFSRSGA